MQKHKPFRPWEPKQTTPLPPSPSDWLSDDHQVYFLLDLVDELRRRQDRLARIRQARKEMEAETAAAAARQRKEEAEEARAKAAAAEESDAAAEAKAEAAREKAIETAGSAGLEPPDLEPLACDALPRRGLARKADGTPTKKTQRNFTDPERHLMQSDGSYLQGYNCQLAVDSDHQVIVAVGVSNQPPDFEHLEPMLERIVACAGALPDVMTMDAGYWSDDHSGHCDGLGIDAYIATGRLPHGQPPPAKRGPLPKDADAKTRMARKLRSKKG